MKVSPIPAVVLGLISLSLPACERMHAEEKHQEHEEHNKIVVTSPKVQDVTITEQYVCQIHSRRHINVRALQVGYLEAIPVREGQEVKEGEVLFTVIPILYQARLEAERAEARLAELEYNNTERLAKDRNQVVSLNEVALFAAKLAKAQANVKKAEAELAFATVKAPFDGIIDRLHEQQGSLIKEGDVLTTLSDNAVMWVYFNMPELRYIEYRAREGKHPNVSQLKLVDSRIELILANGSKYDQTASNTVTIEGDVNFETGNFKLRADFPNPDRLLRHGQTGTVRILRAQHDAVVIPQRATYEILDKQYVWVVGEDKVVHQRPITIAHELEDKFVIESGLDVKDKFILEGVRQVRDGDKVDAEFVKPDEALSHQKFHAE